MEQNIEIRTKISEVVALVAEHREMVRFLPNHVGLHQLAWQHMNLKGAPWREEAWISVLLGLGSAFKLEPSILESAQLPSHNGEIAWLPERIEKVRLGVMRPSTEIPGPQNPIFVIAPR